MPCSLFYLFSVPLLHALESRFHNSRDFFVFSCSSLHPWDLEQMHNRDINICGRNGRNIEVKSVQGAREVHTRNLETAFSGECA